MKAKKNSRTSKDFSVKWWWYGLVEDLYLACKDELQALEKPVRRNGFINPVGVDLPPGWKCKVKEQLLEGDGDALLHDSYDCLYDSPQHKAIRSRYAGKIFQRRLGFFTPVILSISGLLGMHLLLFSLQWQGSTAFKQGSPQQAQPWIQQKRNRNLEAVCRVMFQGVSLNIGTPLH